MQNIDELRVMVQAENTNQLEARETKIFCRSIAGQPDSSPSSSIGTSQGVEASQEEVVSQNEKCEQNRRKEVNVSENRQSQEQNPIEPLVPVINTSPESTNWDDMVSAVQGEVVKEMQFLEAASPSTPLPLQQQINTAGVWGYRSSNLRTWVGLERR